MNRRQRKLHARLWPMLAIVILAGLVTAIVVKSTTHQHQYQMPTAADDA
jgi:hypothetical protein